MRVVISHCVVQVAFHIVIRLVLRIGVVDIHFITITIFSLSITSPSIGSINVIDVSLFQIFAASTAFTPYTAALPAHVGKADERKSNRNRSQTQEDVESARFRL